MTQKRNIIHTNFILGILGYVLLLTGVVMTDTDIETRRSMVIAAFSITGVHWIWSMISVWRDKELRNKDAGNYFWLALVIMIPPLAGLMYYMIYGKRVQI